MSSFHRLLRGWVAALVPVAAAACVDDGTPAGPGSGDARPVLAAAADGTLRDGGINPRDTHFAFSVTTTHRVEPRTPSEGFGIASVDEGHQTDESAYVEAGYGGDGALRFNLYSDGAADPRVPAPPPVVRTVGNQVSVQDEWGNVRTYSFNDFMEGVGLPGGDLSAGSPYGSLYNPLGSRGGGGSGPGGGEPIYMTGLDPERTKVRRVRDDVLQITTSTAEQPGIQATVRAAITTTRTFRRRSVPTSDGGEAGSSVTGPVAHWLLESVEQTASVPRGRGNATAHTRTTYRYVAAHIHRGNDERREREARSTPAPAPRHAASRASGAITASGWRGLNPGSDGIDLCEEGWQNLARTVTPGGGGVVYQHGFCSDASTWSAMRQRVPETHRVGVEQSYSLNSDAPIESQVDDLAQRLSAVGVQGNVVVGHSQGGLVARRLGQRRPDLVSGVVTIGTPHEGALIASRPPYVVQEALHDAMGFPCFGALCGLVSEVDAGIAAGLVSRGVGTLVPAAGDDQPGSAFIQRVNGRSEYQYETFRRASIAMSVSPRWALFRMIGDGRSSRDRLLRDEPLKGQRYVSDAEDVYTGARVMRFMALVLRWRANDYGSGWDCHQTGYATSWEPCYNASSYAANWWNASYWYYIADALGYIGATVVWVMDTVDVLWDDFTTARSGGTDGFVQLASQHYPTYVPGAFPVKQFQIDGQEAHSGETASTDVLERLRFALDEAGLLRP